MCATSKLGVFGPVDGSRENDAMQTVLGNHPKPAIHNHLKTGQR